ncbi:MAG: dTMP kinase [Clostridia bacterium]
MGKLIVIEGVDASGKETQTGLLCEYLEKTGKRVQRITFPDYDSPSSALVKMYLGGDFGADPGAVNPYAAAMFYAVDRFASFKMKWERFMDEDVYIVADRYVTSNVIYQAAKLEDAESKEAFIRWLNDLEYTKLGLPVPDKVFFLNMEPAAAAVLMAGRKNKITGEDAKDIHEKNSDYLLKAYNNACFAAEKSGWTEIKCSVDGNPRTIEEIHKDIIANIE